MRLNLEIDAGIGRAGIWTGDDRAPYIDPLNNLSRVRLHTDLDYIRVVETRVAPLSLPAVTGVTSRVASYPLFAHGRAGFPFILGEVAVNGERVGFTGSVPVQFGVQPNTRPGFFGRWLALGADATEVIVHEYLVAYHFGSGYESFAAIDLDITVHITDESLE